MYLCVGRSHLWAAANALEDLFRYLPRKRGEEEEDEEFPAHPRKGIRRVPSIVRRENVNGA